MGLKFTIVIGTAIVIQNRLIADKYVQTTIPENQYKKVIFVYV